ncbi:actin related protein 8 [Tieghemostelium lacteum]|uniref:Actin related protein 8 n=1 Tax=Tieghemostelium lacteum TaxID=361077 RepID=A0A152A9Z8_TIELA|nr:actin related protein 8 [Tieghemostelium lacteum]|eukprot:KYR03046.1 actin related protein 8 [Tieghemostelium lacteum]
MESKVVVINHGSHSLKIGLASDISPRIIPNFIARRRKTKTSVQNNNSNSNGLPSSNTIDKGLVMTQLESVKNAIRDYQATQQPIGNKIKIPTNNIVYNELNSMSNEKKKKKPISYVGSSTTPLEPLKYSEIDYCIGDDALEVSRDQENWICYQPISMGTFNVSREHSLRSLCDELVEMWKYAITRYLGIPSSDLSIYGCVYVVPDFYDRRELKEITSMILKQLPFTSMLLYQESVCHTFGASMSTQCVLVDIGHDKIQISCVDEGYLHQNSRITLKYGSNTQRKLLEYLLVNKSEIQKYYFPTNIFPDQQNGQTQKVPYYIKVFESLKHEYLNFQFENMKQQKVSLFKVQDPKNEKMLNIYRFNVEELYQLVAMSIFFPQLLLEFQKNQQTLLSQQQLTQDYEEIIEESSLLSQQDFPILNNSGFIKQQQQQQQQQSDRYSHLALDTAIYRSVMILLNERIDTKKKYMNNILVVGGGSQVAGFTDILKYRLQQTIENTVAPPTSTTTTILLSSDVGYYQNIRTDIDPTLMAWKGGAIIGCLESSKEIWITRNEYKNGENTSILRDKLPF